MDKIMEVDAHVGAAVSGLTADALSMVEHGRVQSQNHYFTYNEPMPVESLTQSLATLSQGFGNDEEVGGGRCNLDLACKSTTQFPNCDAEKDNSDGANDNSAFTF